MRFSIGRGAPVIPHTDRGRLGQKTSFPHGFNVLKSGGVLKKHIHTAESTFAASYPITVIEQTAGYVIWQHSLDSTEEEFKIISRRGFGLAALLGAMGVLTALSTAYRITRPINQVMEGMGRGLAVSYGIIRKHGGELKIESEIGRGTFFAITFYRIEERETAASRDTRFHAIKST